MECPLALYLFSKKKENIEKVTAKCQFGGGCVNDTIIHLATPYMGLAAAAKAAWEATTEKTGLKPSPIPRASSIKNMDRSSGAISALSSGQKVAFEKSTWIEDKNNKFYSSSSLWIIS